MDPKEHDKVYLVRDGMSRRGRFPAALNPDYARVDDRQIGDFLEWAALYAKELVFYDAKKGGDGKDGDWSQFFSYDPADLLSKLEGNNRHEPHLALFLAFLKLLRYPVGALNGITARHLDFYYKKVLGLKEKEALPDKVHLVFELKKNIHDLLVPSGTRFKAGKDDLKRELQYALAEDLVVNRAAVESLRSVYVDPDTDAIRIAPVANSSDGLGGALDKALPKWDAFGRQSNTQAEIGFALSSPILAMAEGRRQITVSLSFSGIRDGAAEGAAFEAFLTGKKGWLGPKDVALDPDGAGRFAFSLTVQADEPAIIGYSAKLHGGDFTTTFPVIRLILKNGESKSRYAALKNAAMGTVRIDVRAEGVAALTLENDGGKLDPAKPFMPFGVSPEAGDSFYVGCEEAFNKKVTEISLNIVWKVPDGDLANYYQNYKEPPAGGQTAKAIVGGNNYFKADLIAPDGSTGNVSLFGADAAAPVTLTAGHAAAVAPGKRRKSRAALLMAQHGKWAKKEIAKAMLVGKGFVNPQEAGRTSTGTVRETFAELRLTTGFLHRKYRELYTNAIVTFSTDPKPPLVLPNEPYTPVIKSIRLNYSASTGDTNLSSGNESSFLADEVEFYHITAFGWMREHAFLRAQASCEPDRTVYFLPQYRHEGELYIGLRNLEPPRNLNLLFQTAEGSADPDLDKAVIDWAVLCDNYWKPLLSDAILSDTTNGLLASGIVRIAVPGEADTDNSLLPDGLTWVRAAVRSRVDAVCLLVAVKANAAAATFAGVDGEQSRSHATLPPGSVSGPVMQVDGMKSAVQPYASFGGRPCEDERAFRTRVSERLRHKNRAVALWDWERLVLENFPSIYKVKCIGHTSPESLAAPGHVTVVAVPDVKNKNAVDPLKPRVDKDTLLAIENFLTLRSGLFVTVHVENPRYVPVKVDFQVRFFSEFDFGHYRDVLNRDIIAFLTPWAYEEGSDPVFGGHIHKSVILKFVEDREYVDYVTGFRMYQGGDASDREIASSADPRAVLVSSDKHKIDPAPTK